MNNLMSNVIFLVSEKFLTTFILLISNIVIIRYLGVDGFGQLALFQLYFALAVTVSEFGVRRVYSSLKSKSREALVFKEALNIKVFFSGVFFVATGVFLFLNNYSVEYYAILLAFVASPFETYTYHFEANLNNQLLSTVRVSVSLILALLRILLCALSVDIVYLILSFAINNVIVNFTCMILAKKRWENDVRISRNSDKAIIRKHLLSRSLFFWISIILVQLNLRTDQFMLSILAGTTSVGIYAGAYKLVEQFMTIPSMLAGVFLPHVSRTNDFDKNIYLKNLYLYSVLISLIVSIICALIAPFVLPILLGNSFIESVPVFQILMVSLPILVLVNLSGLYYSVHKLERYAMFRNLFGLLLSLILNFLFIKQGGVLGAAISVLISYFCVAFIVEWFLPITRRNAQLKLEVIKDIFTINVYRELVINVKSKFFKKR
ncbi:oligosaccharide flippase family protein [Serratia fonticola]|uniref:oligosaccharide flippase family protein n=1 Tax=Serratia fonticola TaxID=47917 RepID=UPI00192AAFF4|nr:oligosaccharide flippase family protein [Serratia fonticola]MBL5824661.1 oligosaccharide flippase family protein [Serratia fonticola]